MSNAEDVKLVVDQLSAVMAQGEQCMGMAFNKPVAEWKEIFNAAAGQMGLPVINIAPLKSESLGNLQGYLTALRDAFAGCAHKPGIILVDGSGNNRLANSPLAIAMSDLIEKLAFHFPKAVYVQIVTDGVSDQPVSFYSMKPYQPG